MAADADVDMGGAPTASDDILNVPPSGTKRNADGQPIENSPAKSDAPRRIRVSKLDEAVSSTPYA